MRIFENFYLKDEDLSINDDVLLIGSTKIINGSIIVLGKIFIRSSNYRPANLIIINGNLTAYFISTKEFNTMSNSFSPF